MSIYQLEDTESKKYKNRIYPIKYTLDIEMTSLSQNPRIKGNFKQPPGIKILTFKDDKKVDKLYTIIHSMYEDLNIDLKNSVIAYINEPRKGQEYYDPNTDLNKYLKRNKRKRRERIHLFVSTPSIKEGALNVIDSLHIKQTDKNYLKMVSVNLLKTYFDKKDYSKIDNVLQKSRLFFLKYTGKHQGHHLHFDSLKRHGPVFIINLGTSFIDYLPFEEITDNDKSYHGFRYKMIKGDVFIMDGDSRISYLHGVPTNQKNKGLLRYAMLLRVPVYYKRNRLCYLTEKYLNNIDNLKWGKGFLPKKLPCHSDTETIK